ncbi:hypothetical protein DPEC_G00210230 [Dallia pectoralis]|uniref:Uncharacterized protein n=1 Tax=Dallia pectoralis TaxID=75939 RepID=A0ACC2G5W2_DALPE|nr:hypothetical protein DPEC_G00210230 [Dallia pectoralis]
MLADHRWTYQKRWSPSPPLSLETDPSSGVSKSLILLTHQLVWGHAYDLVIPDKYIYFLLKKYWKDWERKKW